MVTIDECLISLGRSNGNNDDNSSDERVDVEQIGRKKSVFEDFSFFPRNIIFNDPFWCCTPVLGTNHSNSKLFAPKTGLQS